MAEFLSEDTYMLGFYRALDLNDLYNVLKNIKIGFPKDGEAELEVLPRSNKLLYVIKGEFYSVDAMTFMHKEIKPKVEKDPNKWIFLVEGDLFNDIYKNIPELIYIYIMADKFKIPIYNPIMNLYNKEVFDAAVKTGMDVKDVYVAYTEAMLEIIEDSGLFDNDLSVDDYYRVDTAVENLSKILNIPKKVIYNAIEQSYKSSDEIREDLIKISNLSENLSSKNIHKIIKKHSEKKNVLIHIHKDHRIILNNL